MIPGIGGHLVSQSYIEQQLLPPLVGSADRTAVGALARDLVRWWRQVTRQLGPASAARAVFDVAVGPLLGVLGHAPPSMTPHAWGHVGLLEQARDPTTGAAQAPARPLAVVIVLPWAASLDGAWRDAVRAGVGMDARWALVANGGSLRIVDCARTWTRLSVEFQFETLLKDPRGVTALWTLAHADALAVGSGTSTPSLAAIIARSEQHAARVCHSLADGVVCALTDLAAALSSAPRARSHLPKVESVFDQALTMVYRVLFLLFAEARGLVPVWHEIYREAYTIDALCTRIAERPDAPGLWAALQAISRMAHAGCRAGDLDVTAFNGRLFSPAHAPLVDARRLPDEVVRRVVLALATADSRAGSQRIAYHDLGVEQLGSVYERVLEYEPVRGTQSIVLTRTSTERKATGSFYTPRSITEFLVRRTLQPLVEQKSADDILALRIVDPAMGSGAFLVAACHYLADHCERAMVRDGQWHAGEISAADRAGLCRQVAERCLYGVDLNPTAVQLARLSLWLSTLASDRPLTFLDHHLAVGDSLVGARLSDLSRPPVRSRSTPAAHRSVPSLPFFDDEVASVLATRVLPERIRLALEPSDTPDAVRRKERGLASLSAPDGPFSKWSRAADVWCALWLWPDVPPSGALAGELLAGAFGARTTLPRRQLDQWLGQAAAIARARAAFHWELAFPEVFFDLDGRHKPDGGFDAVIGNPPWDMLRADAGSDADREAGRARTSPLLRFVRASGIFACQSGGHPNRYQLFLERTWQLTRPGGRFGLILPSGLATDHGSAALRRHLFDRSTIDTWLGFSNRQAIFPIHRSVRFVLLAGTLGGSTERLTYRCGMEDPMSLDRYASLAREEATDGATSISRSRLESWDPEHLTVPEITTPTALAILAHAAATALPLSSTAGWGARFGRELNATDDRPHFVRRVGRHAPATGPGRTHARDSVPLPIVEGKHLSSFRVDLDAIEWAIPSSAAERLIDPATSFRRSRIAYRDVASATNRVTLIAARLPPGTLSTHTVFCLKTPLGDRAQWCLLAILNSLVANYLVRLHVTTHVTTALMARLPVPRPAPATPAFRELGALARTLAASGIDTAPDAYARLNAIVAALYQMSPDHYAHVVESFPLLPHDLRLRCVTAFPQ